MAILNYLSESLETKQENDILPYILESLLNELAETDIDELEPDNFDHDGRGNYTFDVDYEHGGEPDTLTMEVSIETDCGSEDMSVAFKEKGGSYTTTDRGESVKEKRHIVSAKMDGVAYCVKYHMDNISCELNQISFAPVADAKDREQNKNRRAKLYVFFAKKYLPKMGVEIKDIKGENSGSVTIYTEPFGGSGDIEAEEDEEARTDRAYEAIYNVIPNNAPDNWKESFVNDMIEQYYMGNYDDPDEVASEYRELTGDLSDLFDYLDKIDVLDEVNDMFNDPTDLFDMVNNHNLQAIAEEFLVNYRWGINHIPELYENDLISSIRDAIDQLIAEDDAIFEDYPDAFYDLIQYIIDNPKEQEWDTADWDDIVMTDALSNVSHDDEDKYKFLKIIKWESLKPDTPIPEVLGLEQDEYEELLVSMGEADSEQMKMDL